MAIQATVATPFGESRSLYIRLNNVEASNHGVPAQALFRGFISHDAFLAGKNYVWERAVPFTANVTQPLWVQAYATLKAQPDLAGALDV